MSYSLKITPNCEQYSYTEKQSQPETGGSAHNTSQTDSSPHLALAGKDEQPSMDKVGGGGAIGG